MGEYVKTRYPGIFQYVGKNGTAYGISYRTGGKKHREIIGPLLGEAQEKLAEKKAMGKRKKWSGRGDLNSRLLGPEPSALPGCATPRTIKKPYAQSAKHLA